MSGYDPTWTWDAGSGTWKRTVDGLPSLVASGAQIAPQNVIVQFTPYTGEGEGQTVGSGDAWIFSDGKITVGKWSRPDRSAPASYVDAASGLPIFLTPGRTWASTAWRNWGSPVWRYIE